MAKHKSEFGRRWSDLACGQMTLGRREIRGISFFWIHTCTRLLFHSGSHYDHKTSWSWPRTRQPL